MNTVDVELKHEILSGDESDGFHSRVTIKRPRTSGMSSSDEDFSNDSSSEVDFPRRSPKRCDNASSSSDNEDDSCNNNNGIGESNSSTYEVDWSDPTGNQPTLTPFMGKPGFKSIPESCEKLEDIYSLLVTDKLLSIIAEETNRYAEQELWSKSSTRLNEWIPTSETELKRFFGLIIWMGLVKLPEISLYWSRDPAYAQSFPPSIMSRNRFELLLRMLQFCNNELADPNDRLHKIRVIVDVLNENFRKHYEPSEILCVDEITIPLRGRIVSKQSSKPKRHKYGIKVMKLCSAPGYTSHFQVYYGKRSDPEKLTPSDSVLTLCKDIFGKGHTLCTDDWYSSVDLAKRLIAENTHLIGTIRPKGRGIPKELVAKKLRRNELVARESQDGITLIKWKGKRELLLLSTKHSTEAVVAGRKGYSSVKPKVFVDFNEGRSYVDMSERMTPHCSLLRKSIKWYKKLVLDLFLNTAVVNAWIIYNAITGINMPSLEFRKRLATHLTHCNEECPKVNPPPMVTNRKRHELRKKEGKFNAVRQRCKLCYQNNVKQFGTTSARNTTVKVVTFCNDCPDKPHLCLACFNMKHRNIPM